MSKIVLKYKDIEHLGCHDCQSFLPGKFNEYDSFDRGECIKIVSPFCFIYLMGGGLAMTSDCEFCRYLEDVDEGCIKCKRKGWTYKRGLANCDTFVDGGISFGE